MSVKDKKDCDWVAVTLCNFGDPGRRETVTKHYSVDAALRAFSKTEKIYGRNGRCWQEDRDGLVINDNGKA